MQSADLMPRSRVNFRLDDRILAELESLAGKGKINQLVEGLLLEFLKNTGRLPKDTQPLPESRGRKAGSGSKKSISGDSTADKTTDSATDPESNTEK
jgi:hypothetical protein